jgi:Protein of unknown function (DUF2442)
VLSEHEINSLAIEMQAVTAQSVAVTADALRIDLSDGRIVSVPLAWYPRLLHGTPKERNNWRLIGDGEGIHWLDLDEDISVESLVLGRPSGESQRSLKAWLDKRAAKRRTAPKKKLHLRAQRSRRRLARDK